MAIVQNRRQFLTTLSLAGAAGLLRALPSAAAEGALETTTVRLAKNEGICIAPQYIAAELLRAEGFTDIRYVDLTEPYVPPGRCCKVESYCHSPDASKRRRSRGSRRPRPSIHDDGRMDRSRDMM